MAHLLNHYTSKGRTWQDEANWLAQDSRDMAERDWLSLQQAYEESQQMKAELADKDAQIVWLTAQLAEKNRWIYKNLKKITPREACSRFSAIRYL